MKRYILSIFLGLCFELCVSAQDSLRLLYDTIMPCDRFYIDVLDQTYCYNAQKKSLSKFMKNGILMARTSVVEIKEPFTFDVSDPFKVLIHCLNTGETFVFDESLGLLQIDRQEYTTSNYAVCSYNTFSRVEFINQRLVIKDLVNRQERKSQEIFLPSFELENAPIQLVSNSRQLALLVPGAGLYIFDEFLVLQHELPDSEIDLILWIDEYIYFKKKDVLYQWRFGKGFAEQIKDLGCQNFSVNQHRLICGNGHQWKIYEVVKRN